MIGSIIRFSVNNKLITGALLLIFVIWGIFSAANLSIDALPDVTNNQVQVITNSPNLATQEVEQFITAPLELEFKSLQDLVELRSTSRSGLSVITIVFKDNVSVNVGRQIVAEKIKIAEEKIPKEYGVPDLIPPTTGLGEIYQYVIVPKKGYENKYSPMELRTIQDWIVKRQLLGTPGVVDVSSFGGQLKQYEVSVRPERLAAMNLSLLDVFTALQKNNQNTGGSYINKGPNIYFIRGEGLITSIEDINNIPVTLINGIPVLIKDIGEVKFGFAPRYGAMTRNGQGETVGAVVLMQKGENAVRVIKNVKERIKSIEKYLPEGLAIDVFVDRTKLISRTFSTVSTNLMEAALIVIFVLILFLGNLRAGLIVASVIPLAMLFAIVLMNLFGVSANLMSMGALDFGLIVDGAVIIVESLLHTFKHKFKGQQLSQTQMNEEVSKGSFKIMNGAVFGQIIILIVYIPIFVLKGIEGKMFMPMAQTVSFAIVGALILSITYVPLMSSLFMNKRIASKDTPTDKGINWLVKRYVPMLERILRFRVPVVIGSLLIFIASIFIFNSLGGEFIPELDEGDFATNYTIRQGSSLPQTIEIGTQLEKIARSFPEVTDAVSKIGTSEIPTDPMPVESADLIMVLKDKKEWTSAKNKEELAEKMNEKMSVIPGVNLSFEQPIQMRFNELIAGVKSDIAIKIFGSDLNNLFSKANEAAKIISKIDGLTDIKVEQTVGMPQLVIKYNRSRIAQYGLNIEDVNTAINTAYAGGYAGVVYEGEKKFDLVVRIPKDENTDEAELKNLLIPLASGKQIPLNEIAEVNFKSSPAQISREDAERRIVIEANVRGRDVESVVKDIQQLLDEKLKLPEGYYIAYGGQFQNLQEAKSRLLIAVPIALLLIFFLLFLTFRSIKEAIIIYSAIPLAAIGGILSLWLRGMNFSISAGVGFIALFGVAVLNGIVLISYYNRLRDEGEANITQRILKGSAVRLRPVLATAAVASLGFLPMAFSNSAGAEVQKPLATVVIGGLVSSTLLTLFLLPVLYSMFFSVSKKLIKPIGIFLVFAFCSFSLNAQTKTLTLEEATNTALKNHPLIRQNDLLIQQQQKLLRSNVILDPLSINGSLGQMNSNLIDYNVGFSQSFRLPASYKADKAQLEQNLNVANASSQLSKNELIKQVQIAYYNWFFAWKHYNLLLEQDSTFREFEAYAIKKYEVGETGLLEKANAKTQIIDINLKKKKALATIALNENALKELMISTEKIEPPKEYAELPKPVFVEMNWVNNPLLIYNDQKINLNKTLVQIEKVKSLPSFALGAAVQSIDKASPFFIFNLGLNVPIFKTGVRPKMEAAELEVKIAELEKEKSQLQLNSTNARLEQQLVNVSDQLNYYKTDGLKNAELILNIALKSYKAGNIGYMEYIQNVKEAMNLKQDYLDTLNEYNQVIIEMNYLLNK